MVVLCYHYYNAGKKKSLAAKIWNELGQYHKKTNNNNNIIILRKRKNSAIKSISRSILKVVKLRQWQQKIDKMAPNEVSSNTPQK